MHLFTWQRSKVCKWTLKPPVFGLPHRHVVERGKLPVSAGDLGFLVTENLSSPLRRANTTELEGVMLQHAAIHSVSVRTQHHSPWIWVREHVVSFHQPCMGQPPVNARADRARLVVWTDRLRIKNRYNEGKKSTPGVLVTFCWMSSSSSSCHYLWVIKPSSVT